MAAPTSAATEADHAAAERSLLAKFGSYPPVCVLFALCQSSARGGKAEAAVAASRGSGGGGGSGELQPLLWQLLELTLRPEDPPSSVGGVVPQTVKKESAPKMTSPSPKSSPRGGAGAASGGRGHDAGGPANGNARESVGGRALVTSPAQLLIARGLVNPSTLVMMAQDLLTPGGGAEARERSARVLHHLWAASPCEAQPEVGTVDVGW